MHSIFINKSSALGYKFDDHTPSQRTSTAPKITDKKTISVQKSYMFYVQAPTYQNIYVNKKSYQPIVT